MIVSMISWGSLVIGDERVVQVPREAPLERIRRILALLRYQIRLANSSIAVVVVTVKWCNAEQLICPPDKEDVGVFLGSILSLLWGSTIQVPQAFGSESNCGKRPERLTLSLSHHGCAHCFRTHVGVGRERPKSTRRALNNHRR